MSETSEEHRIHDDMRLALLCLRLRARAIHVGNGLHARPVSEEHLRQTEERLGFRLPTLLRRLYTTVANGAEFFTPSEIFYGIADEHRIGLGEQGTIDDFRGKGRRLDEATVAALQAHRGAYVTCDEVPKDFVVLCESGGISIWLDGATGHLFASDNVLGQDGEVTMGFSFWASSVDEWIERKLAADPFPGDGSRQPLIPLTGVVGNSDASAHAASSLESQNGLESQGESQPKDRAVPDYVRTWLEQQHRVREARRLRLERESQRLRLVRRDVVRLLSEVADIQHTVAAEVGEARVVEEAWGDPPLRSLADAEAQLYEMERILESGLLTSRATRIQL